MQEIYETTVVSDLDKLRNTLIKIKGYLESLVDVKKKDIDNNNKRIANIQEVLNAIEEQKDILREPGFLGGRRKSIKRKNRSRRKSKKSKRGSKKSRRSRK